MILKYGKPLNDGSGLSEYRIEVAFVAKHLDAFTEITHRDFTYLAASQEVASDMAHNLTVHLHGKSWDFIT